MPAAGEEQYPRGVPSSAETKQRLTHAVNYAAVWWKVSMPN